MVEKLKPLNMSFDEALTRLAKVPKSKKPVQKKVVKQKQAGVEPPRPAGKKSG
ncbi:MAG: hypothetical protein JNN20_08330 [Betaproteobacteria bacterium]|nr:hypothetical protein [Betaproteobacteria bacterium]